MINKGTDANSDDENEPSDRVLALLLDVDAALHEGRVPVLSAEAIKALSPDERDQLEQARQKLTRIYAESVSRKSTAWGHTATQNNAADASVVNNQPVFGVSPEFQTFVGIQNAHFGRFEILRGLGAGGHGVVFLARDPVLDRLVALKVPKPDVLVDPSLRKRFLVEGRSAATLTHPNIVTIFESHEIGTICYLAQDYIPGPTLAVWLKDHAKPVAPRIAAEFILQLTEAVAFAHDCGILHRDIKPGNVLLAPLLTAERGSDLNAFAPKLSDFGIAKMLTGEDSTSVGAVIGTRGYMSPEQAAGLTSMVKEASDIYSLGAVLYELLVNQRVHQTENGQGSLRQVSVRVPVNPRKIVPDTPVDLDAVCMKCLSYEPSDRYPTARALVDDLRRFIDGRSVVARPQPLLVSLSRWSRRNPVIALLSGVVAASILLMLAGSLWYNARLNQSLKVVRQHEQVLQVRTEALRRRAYAADLAHAAEAWQSGNRGEAQRRLDACVPREGESDLRSFPYWMLSHQIQNTSRIIGSIPAETPAAPLVVNSTKDVFYCGEPDGVIRVRSLPEGKLLHELKGHEPGAINSLHLSAQGDVARLVSAGNDGTVRVWDLNSRRELLVLSGHKGRVMTAQFIGKDAEAIASGAEDHMVRIWKSDSGVLLSELVGHTDSVRAIVEQTETGTLYSSSADQTIRAWDWKSGNPDLRLPDGRLRIPHDAGFARSLALTPDQSRIAAGFRTGRLIQWNVQPEDSRFGEVDDDRHFVSGVRALAWIDDDTLVIGFADSRIAIGRDRHDFNELLAGHNDWVLSAAVTSEAGDFITSSKDGTIRFWPAEQVHGQIRIASRHHKVTSHMAWKNSFLAACVGKEMFAYEMPAGKEVIRFDIPRMPSGAWSTLSVDGSRYLTTEDTDKGRFFSAFQCQTGKCEWQLAMGDDAASAGTLSSNGKFVHLCMTHDIWTVDVDSGLRHSVCKHPQEVMDVQCFPNSSRLASVSKDGRIRIWDASSGTLIKEWQGHKNSAQKVAISEDGAILATSGEDLLAKVWQTVDEKEIASFAVNFELRSLYLVDDGRTLVTSASNQMRFWSIEDQSEVMNWTSFPAFSDVLLSPNRKTLAIQLMRHVRLLRGVP